MKRGWRCGIAGAILLSPFAGHAQPPQSQQVNRQPEAVRAFIQRHADCNHWAGEEPYDAARGREIARRIKQLRCDRLDRDRRVLLSRFPDDPALPVFLDAAGGGVAD